MYHCCAHYCQIYIYICIKVLQIVIDEDNLVMPLSILICIGWSGLSHDSHTMPQSLTYLAIITDSMQMGLSSTAIVIGNPIICKLAAFCQFIWQTWHVRCSSLAANSLSLAVCGSVSATLPFPARPDHCSTAIATASSLPRIYQFCSISCPAVLFLSIFCHVDNVIAL